MGKQDQDQDWNPQAEVGGCGLRTVTVVLMLCCNCCIYLRILFYTIGKQSDSFDKSTTGFVRSSLAVCRMEFSFDVKRHLRQRIELLDAERLGLTARHGR